MIDEPDKLTDLVSADPASEDAAPVDSSQIEAADQPETQSAGTPGKQPAVAASEGQESTPQTVSEVEAAQEGVPDDAALDDVALDDAAQESAVEQEFDSSEIDATEIDEEIDEELDAELENAELENAELEDAELDDVADDDVEEEIDEGLVDEDLVDESERVEMDWYILKVQSNRERSIAEALQRKIAIEGLDRYFGQVIVPTEKVTEFKGGKKRIVERKLWPGYIVVNMHINDDTWFAVRETSGIGDFTGAAGKPTPMQAHEVAKIVQQEHEESEEAPKLAIKFKTGDRIKVREGNFENFEGEVGSIDEASGRVTVMINIFGRSTPVELEYWQIDAL